jgi:hypothetical protein
MLCSTGLRRSSITRLVLGHAHYEELLGPAAPGVLSGQALITWLGVDQDHLAERPGPGHTMPVLPRQRSTNFIDPAQMRNVQIAPRRSTWSKLRAR